MRKIVITNLGRNASPSELFQEYLSDTRQRCRIITGNLLGAYSLLKPGSKGRIISFTMRDGSTQQGILLPAKFDPDKDLRPQKG